MDFVWDAKDAAWNEHYNDLSAFRMAHGHCRVSHTTNNRGLWVWTRNLRRDYKELQKQNRTHSNTLTLERLERLDAIHFWETVRTHRDVWEERVAELSEFSSTYGHVDVPQDDVDNPALGQWVMNVRTDYKRYLAGLPTGLTSARIAELEKLDFRWNVKQYTWFTMFERLKQHVTDECDNNAQMVTNAELKLWLTKQRHEYQRTSQNRKSSLTQQRIEALETLSNFSWSGRSNSIKRGPSTEDWAKLFEGIREKGITPGMRPKQHWFEGQNRFQEELKDTWTEDDLLALWNQEEDSGEEEAEDDTL